MITTYASPACAAPFLYGRDAKSFGMRPGATK